MNLEAIFKLHCDIPREGPGSDEATRKAVDRLPPLPPAPQILDLGCGPGRQTLVLAKRLGAPVTAIDIHEPYLVRLREAAAAAGVENLITARIGNMSNLDERLESIDLIWAECSIYVTGFAEGLKLWRPLLKNGGIVAASDAAWLTDDPPAEALNFWNMEYPAMTTIDGNVRTAAEAGYEVFDHFVLPNRCWWDEYYIPLAERAAKLRPDAAEDSALIQVLDETEREIDIVRRYGDSFGSVHFLMKKSGSGL